MPEDQGLLQLPFLIRKMLSFEFAAAFSLIIDTQSFGTDPITIRGATRQGPFILQVIPNGTGTVKTDKFRLTDVPIWLSIVDDGFNYSASSLYIRADLDINGDRLHTLILGYCYSNRPLTWPLTLSEESSGNSGLLSNKVSADPAAGAELSYAVPENLQIRVRSVTFQLVAAAAAASRVVNLVFTRQGTVMYRAISNTSQIISETKNYFCFPTSPGNKYADGSSIIIGIPDEIWLNPGDTITTETSAINAGDNYGVMTIGCDQYITSL